VLALIGVLAFAMLSLAALTTDLGLAASEQLRLEVAAEAAALAALREEARLEYELARGEALSRDELLCAPTPEACVSQLAHSRGLALADRMLGATGSSGEEVEVDLGPGDVRHRLVSCGEGCWEAAIDRSTPLLFGQGSWLGFQGGSLRALRDARDRGSVLPRGEPPVEGALRTRGIPIGGVAGATARPAVRVGPFVEASGLPGRAPFALTLDAWRDLDGLSQPLEVDGLDLVSPPDDRVGRRIRGGGAGLRAGEPLEPGAPPGAPAASLERAGPPSGSGYVAYVPLTEEGRVEGIVVGFGHARVEVVVDGTGRTALVVQRLVARVAPGNASASPRFIAGTEGIASVLAARTEDALLQAPVPR